MLNHIIWKMPKETIDEWLVAIERMLNHYSGKQKLVEHEECPLCFPECDDCLWEIIEEIHCSDMVTKIYDDEELAIEEVRDNLRFKKWRDLRLRQLKKWKSIMKHELKSRKNHVA